MATERRRVCDAIGVKSTAARKACCGRPTAEDCRCYTEAAQLAAAVREFVGRRARAPQDAEDITQETLLRLYRGASGLKDERSLEAWMYRIARSAIIDHYRRAAVRPAPIATDQFEPIAAVEADPQRPDAMLAACLTPLLARLPISYRTALELTDLGGLTQDEAASRLGLSTSGMKSRVQRGRRLLRNEVTKCCRIELDARGALSDATPRGYSDTC